MQRDEIRRRVTKVVCQVLDVDESMVEPNSHFVFDLGAESTQSVELVAGFESEFDIEMDEEEALSVQTVGGAVDYISKYVEGSRSGSAATG